MIPSPPLRRAAVAALAALAITWPGMVSAWAQAQPREGFARTSPSGSYLAARHAGDQRDVAAAASYYRAALRGDPGNNELLGRTFVAVLANGEVDEGVKLAERVLQVDKHDRIARLVLGVRAIKQKQYPVARRELAQSISGPITDLAATLLSDMDDGEPERGQAGYRLDRQACRRRLVRHLQGSACRLDPRRGRSEEGGREALRALLQARSEGATRGAELWKFSFAAGKHC